MSYKEDMRRCRAYIDEHPDEELSAEALAESFGYSFWHFCHIFHTVNGVSVGTYLRDRRLARAAVELIHGGTVTRAGILAGFDTPSGFSRAFLRRFGLTPSAYQKWKGRCVIMAENINITMVDIPAFSAAGYKVYPEEVLDCRENGAYWLGQDFSAVSAEEYAKLTYPGYAEIGTWLAGGETMDSLYYFLGPTLKADNANIPEGMDKFDFEAARCAVFTLPQIDDLKTLQQTVRDCWQYIFTEWFEQNPYKLDETKPYFECYRGRDSYICVPVITK